MPAICYRNIMIMGIAMVKVVPGRERSVYCFLKGKEGILDLYHVFGEYDFFLIIQAESLAKLKELVEDIQESHHAIKARFIGKLR
jgi:DNA-binding Lrp family transcriptional regulator